MDYIITEILPKDGIIREVHETMRDSPCEIMYLKVGDRGWLLVDVGDLVFGPHRISISTIIHVTGQDDDSGIKIETENTFYCLKRMPSKEGM